MEILKQIQLDLINDNVSLSTILRKSRILAAQLSSNELKNWVNQELNGYKSIEGLPDYRIIKTGCLGTIENSFQRITNYQVRTWKIEDKRLKDLITIYKTAAGILTIEENSKNTEQKYFLPIAVTTNVNNYFVDDGYHFIEIMYAINSHDFKQILDTVKNRLLEFILKLDKNWHIDNPPTSDDVKKIFNVTISPGANMSIFDQRGQKVNTQYNSAGNISITSINTKEELIESLSTLIDEIRKSKDSRSVDLDVATEAEYHLIQAVKEAKAEKVNKKSFVNHLKKAKEILHDVAALITVGDVLIKIIESAKELL